MENKVDSLTLSYIHTHKHIYTPHIPSLLCPEIQGLANRASILQILHLLYALYTQVETYYCLFPLNVPCFLAGSCPQSLHIQIPRGETTLPLPDHASCTGILRRSDLCASGGPSVLLVLRLSLYILPTSLAHCLAHDNWSTFACWMDIYMCSCQVLTSI